MKKLVRVIALVLAMVLMTGCTLFPSDSSSKDKGSVMGDYFADDPVEKDPVVDEPVIVPTLAPTTKTYRCLDLTMEVPVKMEDVSGQPDYLDFHFTLDSPDLAIFGLSETFIDYPQMEEYTTADYAELVIEIYGVNSTVMERPGKDYHYIIYTADTTSGEFTYMAGIFKNDYGFWMVQICGPTTSYDQEEFFSYMDTVKLD